MRCGYARGMADTPDASGYGAAIEAIPTDALSSRQQRIAAAVALVRTEGRTVSHASRATGIPRPTIYRHLEGVASIADTSKGDREAHRRILDASQAIAIRAADNVLDALESGDMKPADASRAFGIAVDKTLALSQTRAESGRGISALAELLAGGGSVTIEATAPAEVIEVESDG